MPTYEIEIPGEGKFRVESDKELSDTQAYQHAAKQLESSKFSDPTSGMTTGEKAWAGAGKAVNDLGLGARQLLSGVPLLNKTDTFSSKKVQADVDEARALDAPLMETTAGKLGNIGGNVAAAVPTMFIPGVNTYAGAGLLGAATGALQPTAEGESRAFNATLGAGAGLLGQAAGNAVGRLVKPVQSNLTGEEARLAAEASKRGIPLTAGQKTGSAPLQTAESVMESLPLTSGSQLAGKQAQKDAYTKAVGATFGSPEANLTPDVLGAARTRIGQSFTDLSARNAANVDNAVLGKLSTVVDDAQKFGTADVARVVNNYADEILSKVDANGVIPGEAYRKLDSAIGRTMRGTSNGDLRNALGQVRDVMREAMDDSISAGDQAAWRDARKQYASLMTVAPLAAKNETGSISGKTLLNAANQSNKNAKFGGPSELAELGRIGRAFVADSVPNSGTAQRLMIQGLLTGGGAGVGAGAAMASGHDPMQGAIYGAGATAAGALLPKVLQAGMNSKPGQAYLSRGLLNLSERELAMLNAASRGGAMGLLGYSGKQ